jgi:hypothetical protein
VGLYDRGDDTPQDGASSNVELTAQEKDGAPILVDDTGGEYGFVAGHARLSHADAL